MSGSKTVNALLILVAGLGSPIALSQNLSTFVEDSGNNASALQRNAGNAVQGMCAALAGAGGRQLQDPAQQDLFLRCNELVQTAQQLQGVTSTTRSLGLETDELLAAVQQVSGEELHSQNTLSTRVSSSQFSNIAGRLNSLRLGNTGIAGGGAIAYADPRDPGSLDDPMDKRVAASGTSFSGGGAAADVEGSRWGWFLEGAYSTGDRDQSANEDGFDFDSTSVTVGIDYAFDSGVFGVSAGLDNYDADFDNTLVVSGGKTEVEGTTGSLFAAWYPGSFYIDAIVSFGELDTDISRRVLYASNNTDPNCACPGENRNLVGETSGDFLAGGLTGGYDATLGNWEVSTTLSINYRDIDIDGYDETDSAPNGGLALRYAAHTIESFRSILGISLSRNVSRAFGVFSPHFRAEWHHEFQDDPLTLVAKYVVEDGLASAVPPNDFGANCISCFRFSTDNIDSDFGLLGVGVSLVFARRLQLYGTYDALVGLDNLASNTFSVGLRGQF